MRKYKFGIPSYKRGAKQRTLQMLIDYGYEKEDIVISTQTEEDYREYSEKYGEFCEVIFTPGDSVTKNRNSILRHFGRGEWVVMLDDDISGFYKLNSGKLERINSIEELDSMVVDFFEFAKAHNALIWGLYPVKNQFFMKNTIDTSNIVNTCLGIINEVRFDESFIAKEDIELCCRVISAGLNVIRFNFICYDAKHRNKGGCYDVWNSDENEKVSERLVFLYPNLLKINRRRRGEVLFTGARRRK